MQMYTLKEAARKANMGVETLKRACEDGLIQAACLTTGQWRIAESTLVDARHQELDVRSVSKHQKKQPQPEAVRWAQEKSSQTERIGGTQKAVQREELKKLLSWFLSS